MKFSTDISLVSVVMPCFNSASTLSQSIESVLLQDYNNLELIIVDDASTDSSPDILKYYSARDKRIKLFFNNSNLGVSNSRNIGILAARGKYICFLDADDFLLAESISLRVNTAKSNSASVVFGPYLRLFSNGILIKKHPPQQVFYRDMLRRNFIGNLTGMYDVEILGKFFQEPIKHEDYLMWCSILRIAKVAYSTNGAPLATYRVSFDSLSGNKFKSFYWHWIVLRRGLKLNIIFSFYYQLLYFIDSVFFRFREAFLKFLL